jgi:alkylation response protein AidB-like acyl-CoA dehydrogenase
MLRGAANQGFLGATLPEQYYGAELDHVSYALLVESLARESMSLAVTLATHVSMVAMSILEHGTAAQKDEWLAAMSDGEAVGAFAYTEPDAGSDAQALRSQAALDGTEVVLTGVKTCVGNGQQAGLYLIFAQGADGIDAFLVPRGTPGLTLGYREPTLGLRSMSFSTVYLEECRLSPASRLGGSGGGLPIARRAWDRMAVALAAAGLGVAASSIDVAVEFAAGRAQFGGPIAQKQAIQNHIADAFIETEALRYVVYHSAWLADQSDAYSLDASVAKALGARVARNVTNRMVQVMGGYGYMEDYPMARKYRDARSLGIIGGPTELHHVAVARHVFAARAPEIEIVP